MYDPHLVLEQVSDRTVLVVVLGALTLGCNFAYFAEAARLGFRDRCAPMALWSTVIFIPHDGNYLLDFNLWFTQYDHWFPKLFWVGLIVTFSLEIVFFTQIVRFGRTELAPQLSQRVWTLYCFAALVAGTIGWTIIKQNLDDRLYLITFMVTVVLCGPASMSLMMRRRTRRGFSVLEFSAFTGIAIGYSALTIVLLGGGFRSLTWIVLSAVAVGYGAVLTYTVHHLPPFTGLPSDKHDEAEQPISTR